MTPLPTLKCPEKQYFPSVPFTLVIPDAAAYIALKMARLFLDAPALARVASMNLCETESNAAV